MKEFTEPVIEVVDLDIGSVYDYANENPTEYTSDNNMGWA